jgi:hypothetical protein
VRVLGPVAVGEVAELGGGRESRLEHAFQPEHALVGVDGQPEHGRLTVRLGEREHEPAEPPLVGERGRAGTGGAPMPRRPTVFSGSA